MLYRLLFLFCFPLLCLRGDDSSPIAPVPEWVKPCDFSLDVPLKPTQDHVQFLLIDRQRNWEEKAIFRHTVLKIVDQVAIEAHSQLRFSYDPTYQTVRVHQIRIFRDGQWHDRLESSRHNLLQREEGLDHQLFYGDLTLVYFLNDIRVGDILEFSHSLMGEHPIFSSHLTDLINLQSTTVLEKVYRRILVHPDNSFVIKQFNTSLEPIITDLSPSLREYLWEAIETPPSSDDNEQPAWHIPEAYIQISQYKTWKELIQQLCPLYTLSQENPSVEMMALVKKWTESTDDAAQRATLALRFVQDEIRYLGFEEGIWGFKPRDPTIILQRRYGDCKDKSVLLRTLLHLMNIPSHPVIVHASKGKRLPDMLPIPHLFNHVVLQLELNGSLFYVDPTWSLQGGTLEDNYFPSYKWGLVISEESNGLIPLPEIPPKVLMSIDTSIAITSPTSAEVNTRTTLSGVDADQGRMAVKIIGWKKTKEELLENAQDRYKGATPISPPVFLDDREKNIITIQESYQIPLRNRAGKKSLNVYSFIIKDGLDDSINLERSSPFALAYPEWIQEHIHIQNPLHDWAADSEDITLENESIFYNFVMKKQNHTADFNIELRHLKDHVPLNAVKDYWNIMQEINPNPSLQLIIETPEDK